mmetsp:Transcript_12209/g.19728  ORF Transcript_12209/g.19728 Transcript_12209/m.19728 type:complete len:219 (-) Transcript_12209:1297-1953(-)
MCSEYQVDCTCSCSWCDFPPGTVVSSGASFSPLWICKEEEDQGWKDCEAVPAVENTGPPVFKGVCKDNPIGYRCRGCLHVLPVSSFQDIVQDGEQFLYGLPHRGVPCDHTGGCQDASRRGRASWLLGKVHRAYPNHVLCQQRHPSNPPLPEQVLGLANRTGLNVVLGQRNGGWQTGCGHGCCEPAHILCDHGSGVLGVPCCSALCPRIHRSSSHLGPG